MIHPGESTARCKSPKFRVVSGEPAKVFVFSIGVVITVPMPN